MQTEQLEALKLLISNLPEEERLQVTGQIAASEELVSETSSSVINEEKADRFVIVFASTIMVGCGSFGENALVGSIFLGIVVGLYTIGWKPFARG